MIPRNHHLFNPLSRIQVRQELSMKFFPAPIETIQPSMVLILETSL